MQEYSIKTIQEMLDKNEITSFKLVQQYLERIKEIDPETNAIIELNPDALDIAKSLDEERNSKGKRSLLHGIPIIIKDNIDTADKMMTTAGSLALEGNYAQKDAFVAKQLKDAGAIILAKANLSEWANMRGKRSNSGWSSRGGQTKNPYVLNRNPCGSSSGSAVAVASNFCTVAVGTETDGSVICPSGINGIVGIKPTIGLVSRIGIIPISHSQDTAGPMTRTVEDAAILLTVMAGYDDKDEVTKESISQEKDYTKFLISDGLKGARLGLNKKHLDMVPKVTKLYESIIQELKDLGAEIVEFDEFPTVEKLDESEYNILLYDYKVDLNKYLQGTGLGAKVHSVEELIKFNDEHKETILPLFGQEHLIACLEKSGFESEEYIDAKKVCDQYKNKVIEFFDENKLDALITPSNGPSWLIDTVNGDYFTGIEGTTSIAAITGFANITVPMGYIQGLPIGLNFIGKAFSEPTLIKIAYSFEQATKVRKPPQFLKNIE